MYFDYINNGDISCKKMVLLNIFHVIRYYRADNCEVFLLFSILKSSVPTSISLWRTRRENENRLSFIVSMFCT